MTLLALGINHNTAPLAIRERVAFAPDSLEQALQAAREAAGIAEVAIVSTCNRTEIYAAGNAELEPLLDWLRVHTHIGAQELSQCYYAYQGDEAAGHMMKVAGGLDSLILGEPQILGQMKSAYAVASQAGTVGAVLHGAFQQVFGVAKRVRSETAIGENPVSVAYAAVTLAQQIFSDLKQDTALLIGAGETIQLVARHLKEQGIRKLIVANRTLDRAQTLSQELGAEAILLADVPEYLPQADIVISSTASQLPILGKGAAESALKKRKHRPVFMLDIAVPRDIEAEVGELDDVYLYTVDDLHAVIDQNKKSREAAADKARDIIAEGVRRYREAQRAQDASVTIRAYREQAESVRAAELDKARRALSAGGDPEKVLANLARGLTNKLLHPPSIALRRASVEGRHQLVASARELFGLGEAAPPEAGATLNKTDEKSERE